MPLRIHVRTEIMTTLNIFVTLALSYNIFGVSCFQFDTRFVGVNFSPYVKNAGSDTLNPCQVHYTLDEIKTMLLVVATRFSKVCTDTVGASNVEYSPNNTYYNDACIIARTAEVAALINKENNNKTVSVLVGIMTYDDDVDGDSRTLTEMRVALEAEQIANSIFPGTVVGFQVFIKEAILNDPEVSKSALERVAFLKNQTVGRNLTIGGFIEIEDVKVVERLQYENFNLVGNVFASELTATVDFFNCKVLPTHEMALEGPLETLSYFTSILRLVKTLAEAILPNLKIEGSSGWASGGQYAYQNIENVRAFYTEGNHFAIERKFPLWLIEAFDNPWKRNLGQDLSHLGFWKLAKDELAGDVSGYVEKILDGQDKSKTESVSPSLNTSSWISGVVVGVVVVVIVAMLLIRHIIRVYKEINSLKQVLTHEEIKEFKLGCTNENNVNDNDASGNAMKKPYDQSLEIPSGKLEIYWDQILGAGQFGSVHKALLKGELSKAVALKTTKTDCPVNALRGLLSEIKILSHLGRHPNIVSICGAYTAEIAKGIVYVALELCTMGSLKSRLVALNKSKSAGDLDADTLKQLFRWALDVASGMEHIAHMGVVHADLATRNVLLTSEGVAKIADFGLSRRLYEYSEYVKQNQDPLPWRWMAIESLKMMHFSSQSDVWSFGVTLWEIFSLGVEPYPGFSFSPTFIESLEDRTRIMSRPSEATPEMYTIMLDCWELQPDVRPRFTQLKARILEIEIED